MIFEMPNCGGCRTCEMACSFKHTAMFVPSVSSLQIIDKDDESGFLVRLHEVPVPQGYACDLCQGRDVPLCVEYCHMADDLMEILSSFDRRKKRLSDDERP